ncbi:hypothetical protein IMCC3088_2271 [Aequoribacter fuscus]|uniref:Uncharacterized protein n=1 Tax=Aequoribacter fuscus TaxID=2518989 RepID=F3L3S9_9GAMM|nr:hypothetical protein IMCC3088_2271 [Aequoribacter fuscus]
MVGSTKDLNPANFIDFNRMLLALIATGSPVHQTIYEERLVYPLSGSSPMA